MAIAKAKIAKASLEQLAPYNYQGNTILLISSPTQDEKKI